MRYDLVLREQYVLRIPHIRTQFSSNRLWAFLDILRDYLVHKSKEKDVLEEACVCLLLGPCKAAEEVFFLLQN